jgi:hypothetical protein
MIIYIFVPKKGKEERIALSLLRTGLYGDRLTNFQTLQDQERFGRNDRDQSRDFRAYEELKAKTQQYKEKYDSISVSREALAKASEELTMIQNEKVAYEKLKQKMLLMVEPELNARTASLEKELAAYNSLLEKIDKASAQELPSLIAELQKMDQQKLDSLTNDRTVFNSRLEQWEKTYDGITQDPKYRIEGPITINDLLARPQCNLLSTLSSPASQLSTTNIFGQLGATREQVQSTTSTPPAATAGVATAYQVSEGRLVPLVFKETSPSNPPVQSVTTPGQTPSLQPIQTSTPPAKATDDPSPSNLKTK